jgi:uncharacterized protein
MPELPLPPSAAWRHVEARDGFESVFFTQFVAPDAAGARIEGRTCGLEAGEVWDIGYVLDVDDQWRTQRARVRSRWVGGTAETVIESVGSGRWTVDGAAAPALDGLADVDLESSACTNLLPVRRLGLGVGEAADAPAVYVRAPALQVERLDQSYRRLADDGTGERYAYLAARFDADFVLPYDAAGLVLDYPFLAVRVA